MATVAVLGGGVSGLSAAYYLSRPAYAHLVKKVVLLESSNRFGGWMHSAKQDDGALFEQGPRSMRTAGAAGSNTLHLIEELGLEDDILPIGSKHPASTNRFLYVNKKLLPLPKGLFGGIIKQPPFSKSLFAFIMREPGAPPSTATDESIHDFVSRRLGSELAQYLVDPLVRGIFAGSTRQLSVRSCFPDLYRYEKTYGSIIRGMLSEFKAKSQPEHSPLVHKFKANKWHVWSLRKGMQQMVDGMVTQMRTRTNVELLTDTPCTQLEFSEGAVKISTPKTKIDCDHVFSSCPSRKLSPMLTATHQSLSEKLLSIPAVTTGVVNLQYPGKVLPVTGFGHLIPSCEQSKVLGVIYESCLFPEHDAKGAPSTRLTCMMGGAWFEELFGSEDSVTTATLASTAEESVRQQLGITAKPTKVIASVLKGCIPQYMVGHEELMEDIAGYIRLQQLPLSLIGSSYRGVSVNDCMFNAKKEVDKFLAHL